MENGYVEVLRNSDELTEAIEKVGYEMSNDDEPMLRSLLRAILSSDIYKEYMEFPATDLRADCEFWKDIFRNVVFVNPDFLEVLEERSVFWNDDLEILSSFVIKGINRIASGVTDSVVLPMYKDDEDSCFGAELFTAAVKNKITYREYIDEVLGQDPLGIGAPGVYGHRGDHNGLGRDPEFPGNSSECILQRIYRDRQILQHGQERPVCERHPRQYRQEAAGGGKTA